MHKVWLWLLALLAFASCKKTTETIEVVDDNGNKIRYERRLNDYAKEGAYVKLNPQDKNWKKRSMRMIRSTVCAFCTMKKAIRKL